MLLRSSTAAVYTEKRIVNGDSRALDLRGIKCPLNWAYAKVRLEQMTRGDTLDLLLDDPRGVRDIPRAAEAEGYAVIDLAKTGNSWRVRIEK
jgi:TusA-related sulfurtransferase